MENIRTRLLQSLKDNLHNIDAIVENLHADLHAENLKQRLNKEFEGEQRVLSRIINTLITSDVDAVDIHTVGDMARVAMSVGGNDRFNVFNHMTYPHLVKVLDEICEKYDIPIYHN